MELPPLENNVELRNDCQVELVETGYNTDTFINKTPSTSSG